MQLMQPIHVTTQTYMQAQRTKGNVNGHIIRFKETDDKTTAETFKWDIYLFGAEASMASNINLSGLTDNNDFFHLRMVCGLTHAVFSGLKPMTALTLMLLTV